MRVSSAGRPLSLLPALLLSLGLGPLAAQDADHQAKHEHAGHGDADHPELAGER